MERRQSKRVLNQKKDRVESAEVDDDDERDTGSTSQAKRVTRALTSRRTRGNPTLDEPAVSPAVNLTPKTPVASRRTRRNNPVVEEFKTDDNNSNDSGLESSLGSGAEKSESLKLTDSDEDDVQKEKMEVTINPSQTSGKIIKKPAGNNGNPGNGKQTNDKNKDESNVPLTDFMANLNVSPSSRNKLEKNDKKIEDDIPREKPETHSTATETEATPQLIGVETPVVDQNEANSSGKLRSSVADAEGMVLAKSYRKTLKETEEFALNYITQEFHHPVITCFRELTKADISAIVGSSKLKKSFDRLEQSIVYLGLIDLMATVNNNPIYGEPTKLSKNVSGVVQKILLEFKNIMGTWALSGNEELCKRYSLILNYLRTLVPMFKKAGFDEELNGILNRVEKEVIQHKSNQEKIKSMNTFTSTTRDSEAETKPSSSDSQEVESRSALNEIVLNVDLNVKLDDSDDDEATFLEEATSNKIFGKPLKGSPLSTEFSVKKSKKPRKTLNNSNTDTCKSPKSNQPKLKKEKPPKSHVPTKSTLRKPKALSKVFNSTNSPKSTAPKRIAEEELKGENDITKKRKTENVDIKVNRNETEAKSSIKSFFSKISQDNEQNQTPDLKSEKPTVNAFALMMNRSREMAEKKKMDKLNAISVPALKVNAVTS